MANFLDLDPKKIYEKYQPDEKDFQKIETELRTEYLEELSVKRSKK